MPTCRQTKARHGGEGAVRGSRRTRRAVRVPGQRRAPVGRGAGHAGPAAPLQALRRSARCGRRRPTFLAHRGHRAHRYDQDDCRWRADVAPGANQFCHHPARYGRHPHGDGRATGGRHVHFLPSACTRWWNPRVPGLYSGKRDARRAARPACGRGRQQRRREPVTPGRVAGRLKATPCLTRRTLAIFSLQRFPVLRNKLSNK